MNFCQSVLDAQPRRRRALVELARDGARREWTFDEMRRLIEAAASTLSARGVRQGDVVMTLIGNRVEWVATMMACFRIGAVALPCTEQLRAKDLRLRLAVAQPKLIVADERNRAELRHAEPDCPVLWIPDDTQLFARHGQGAPLEANTELKDDDPALITFTSGTAGEPKAVVHGQRYLHGQRTQAKTWLGSGPGDLVWCTAASGWSKSARNVFMAPWLTGATALLHDARFDPHERLDLIEREQVDVLCMAPTEYRVIAKRAQLRALPSLTQMVAAGEALNPEVLHVWREATGLDVRDGYGQTETGQMTAMPIGPPARPGSMGKALDGVNLIVEEGGADRRPAHGADLLPRLPGRGRPTIVESGWRIEDRRDGGPWHTGDRVSEDADGYLHFEGRADDVIVSAGYRIGPFEVESALVAHPAVAEAAAVAAPNEERGTVVRAVIVLRDGYAPSSELARELQDHVKSQTAPYKYPRIVEFTDELPKTASGKVRRSELRGA